MSNNLAGVLAYLMLAIFFFFDVRDGLDSGKMRLLYTRFDRKDRPVLFWYGVALSSSLVVISCFSVIYYLYRLIWQSK